MVSPTPSSPEHPESAADWPPSALVRAPSAPHGPKSVAVYDRRHPEHSILYQLLIEHLETFLAHTRERTGSDVPEHVERELRAYLQCGILDYGFVRVRCSACNDDLLVAFSCRSRTICPSCATRRMQDGAAHLVDRVLPHLGYRQWVMSFPKWLRVHLAFDTELASQVLQIVTRAIFSWQHRKARSLGFIATRSAAVTFVQRFGSAIQLNPHFHMLIPDGVFGARFAHPAGEPPPFIEIARPTDEDVQTILLRIVSRVLDLCQRLELTDQAFTLAQQLLTSVELSRLAQGSIEPRHLRRRSAFHRGFPSTRRPLCTQTIGRAWSASAAMACALPLRSTE